MSPALDHQVCVPWRGDQFLPAFFQLSPDQGDEVLQRLPQVLLAADHAYTQGQYLQGQAGHREGKAPHQGLDP